MEKTDFMKHLCLKTGWVYRMFSMIFLILLLGHSNLKADTVVERVKLNISVKNASVLQIFSLIKQQTKFNFVYNDQDISRVGLKSIDMKEVDIITILNKCVEGSDLVYEFLGNIVVFKKRGEVVRDSVREILIKGSVKDKQGLPLPGVTVVIKKTKLGVVTDQNGIFKLTLPKKDTSVVLVFSFIGMTSKEVKLGNKTDIHVVLEEKSENLEDVVVTGYANISRKSFTGNVTTITADELKKVSPTNIIKSIQLFDPSFRIAVNNEMGSDPNTMPKISIRGSSGIGITELEEESVSKAALQNNPNLPTFILDGFEVNVDKVYDMDVNRIESLTILKDAAATAIYGSRAANGVIVITTVAPKPGEILVNYSYNLALQVPDLSDYNLMNAREKIESEYEAGLFEGEMYRIQYYHNRLLNVERGVETDWMFIPLRNTFNSKHFLRLEGGGRELRYGIDVSYNGNEGVMKGSERKTIGLGFELQYNIQDRLVFRNVASFSGVNSEESPYGGFAQYSGMNPYLSYVDENGKTLRVIPTLTSNSTIPNPVYESTLDSYNKSSSKEFTNNFSIQYWLPSKKINFKANVALTYRTGESDSYTSPESGKYGEYAEWKGEKTIGNNSATTIDGGLFAYYNDVIHDHYVNLVFGVNMKESKDKDMSVYMRDLPSGGYANPQFAREVPNAPSASGQTNRLFGGMISMNYTYKNIYLMDVTGRLDGSSSFGSEKRFAPFWSGGLGINLHQYTFIQNVGWISELKIRGSYGVTGKANFPARTARTVYAIGGESTYPTGLGASMAAMGNRDLKWEKTKIMDFGLNVNLFNGLLTLNGAYYNRKTVDLIADMYVSSSSGFTSYKENVGEILNEGYEVSARVKLMGKHDISWYVGGNLAANTNEISKVSDAMKTYNKLIEEKYNRRNTIKPIMKYEEGASTTSIYAIRSQGIDPQTGKEMYLYRDGSSSFLWSSEENVVCGNTEPKINGSFSSNFYFKGLSVDLYFTYTYGGQQYNQTLQSKIENANIEKNVDKRVFTERWKNPGDITLYKSLEDWQTYTQPTSRFVQDDNTLTLQSISMGYDLPSQWVQKVKLDRVRFSFNMSDVFRISSIKQERGLAYPFAHGYNFSLNVGF